MEEIIRLIEEYQWKINELIKERDQYIRAGMDTAITATISKITAYKEILSDLKKLIRCKTK